MGNKLIRADELGKVVLSEIRAAVAKAAPDASTEERAELEVALAKSIGRASMMMGLDGKPYGGGE